jgi:hypothetical protein
MLLHEFADDEETRPVKPASDIMECPVDLTGFAGEFVKIYSQRIECSVNFLYFLVLACLGYALSGHITLSTEIRPDPRIYLILLGESADDRKSTAISIVVNFFKRIMGDLFPLCHGVGSAEGLQEGLKESNKLMLVLDEFRQLVSKCKIDGSILLPMITTLFESDRYESRTKGHHMLVEGARFSLTAASTVDTWEKICDSTVINMGFNNRLLLVTGRGKKRFSIPERVSDDEYHHLATLLIKLLDTYSAKVMEYNGGIVGPEEMNITDDAKKLFHEWYMSLERSTHTKRLDSYALRFMVILAVNDFRTSVDAEIVQKVVSIMNWQLRVRQQLDPIDADNQGAKVEEKIRRALREGGLTESILKRKIHADRVGLWFFKNAIDNLRAAGEVVLNKKTRLYELV